MVNEGEFIDPLIFELLKLEDNKNPTNEELIRQQELLLRQAQKTTWPDDKNLKGVAAVLNSQSTLQPLSSYNPSGSVREKGESSSIPCMICNDVISRSDILRGPECKHRVCEDCFRRHLKEKLQQKGAKVFCPVPTCESELRPEECKEFVQEEVFDRWENAMREDDETGFKCWRIFCMRCRVRWHRGYQKIQQNKQQSFWSRIYRGYIKPWVVDNETAGRMNNRSPDHGVLNEVWWPVDMYGGLGD